MFLTIVIIFVLVGIVFCIALTSLIIFLINMARKNDVVKSKSLKVLIPSAIIWIVLLGVNIVLLVNYVYKHSN